jgi:hypothetical protein
MDCGSACFLRTNRWIKKPTTATPTAPPTPSNAHTYQGIPHFNPWGCVSGIYSPSLRLIIPACPGTRERTIASTCALRSVNTWHVSFVEAGLETVLPCKLTFTTRGRFWSWHGKGHPGDQTGPGGRHSCGEGRLLSAAHTSTIQTPEKVLITINKCIYCRTEVPSNASKASEMRTAIAGPDFGPSSLDP